VRGVPQLVRWVNKFAIMAAFVLGALGARGVERRRRRCLVVLSFFSSASAGTLPRCGGKIISGSLPRVQPILIEQIECPTCDVQAHFSRAKPPRTKRARESGRAGINARRMPRFTNDMEGRAGGAAIYAARGGDLRHVVPQRAHEYCTSVRCPRMTRST
jgi:hypothetical protein